MPNKDKNIEIPQCVQPAVTSSAVLYGDCLELMKNITDRSVDMILCDLPYGTTACKWDVVLDFDKLWEQYERIIKPNGAILLFGSEPFSSAMRLSNIKSYRYDLIWEKSHSRGFLNAWRQPMRKHENISLFYKKQPTYNPILVDKKIENIRPNSKRTRSSQFNGGEFDNCETKRKCPNTKSMPDSILKFNSKVSPIIHPTQKPVDLFEYLIKTYTNEGETVLDNCAGSGTTGIACINTNRNCILIENEQKYFDVINQRIYKHKQSNV
jgi:DNA modification methylase